MSIISLLELGCEKNMMSYQENWHSLVVFDEHSNHRSLSLDDSSSADDSPKENRLSLEHTNDYVPYIGRVVRELEIVNNMVLR